MRVSQLVRREPFGQILSRTLEEFWSERNGCPVQVQWCEGGKGGGTGGQRGLGNSALNFFATADTPLEAFDVVRRQYGRSASRWKRLLQSGYVSACTGRQWRRFASLGFVVAPAVSAGGQALVMGGNHRLRIVNFRERSCTVVLKSRSDRGLFLDNELRFRTELQVRAVPPLLERAPQATWFVEEYVAGIGAPRLPEPHATRMVDEAARQLAQEVVRPSLRFVSAREWVTTLQAVIADRLNRVPRSAFPYRDKVEELGVSLGQVAGAGTANREIGVAWSHGDFQRGNIMADGERVWIVDWESVGKRFAGYDPLTLASGSRGRDRLMGKLQALLDDPAHFGHGLLASWPGVDWTPGNRMATVAFYLLEELVYHLTDNADPVFYEPAAWFRDYYLEIAEAGTLLQGRSLERLASDQT